MLSILINLLLAVHVIVSLLIVLLVLMQRPKNEGLGAAFGGGMTESMFGAQTSNVLAKITRWLGGLFFLLTLSLSVLYARQSREVDALSEELRSAPAPEVAATPAAATAPETPVAPMAPETPAEPAASPAEELPAPPEASAPAAPAEAVPATEQAAPAEAPAATPAS